MAMQGSLAGLKTTGDVQARKAATSAFFGFFVDMFDVFLPAIVMGNGPPAVPLRSRTDQRRSSATTATC